MIHFHSYLRDQSDALRLLTEFIHLKSELHLFVLRGFAGTGKTTILAHVAKKMNEHNKVVLLAPTGRAARVLSSYCGIPAHTIHKKIYWLADDLDGGLNFTLQKNKWVNTLFIIDESSMLSSNYVGERDVLEDLMRYVYRGKGCKILFAGDGAQLPPVNMDYSPALDAKYMENRFNMPVMETELRKVIRQAESSGILKNATELRMHIQDNNKNIVFDVNDVDFMNIDGLELQEQLEENINEYGVEDVLFITRSNKKANQFNNELRNRLLFREEEIETSDILMCVKNNYNGCVQKKIRKILLQMESHLKYLKY